MSWTGEVLARQEAWGRAPSAHNTQPWVVTADDDRLLLDWDPARELVVTDPTRRDLWLGLGAAAEYLVLAAANAGFDTAVEWAIYARRHRAAVLRMIGEAARADLTLDELIMRRTARGPYAAPYPSAGDLAVLDDAARDHGCRVRVLDADLVDRLLPQADRWTYSTPAQVAELRRWLRLRPEEAAYRQDGLSDRALALTPAQARALRTALSPAVWRFLSRVGGPRLLALAGQEPRRGTMVAFTAPREASGIPEQIAEAGRALVRVWLTAARHGWHVHPLSQLLDAPVSADAIGRELGSGEHALSAFRVGVPLNAPVMSARRDCKSRPPSTTL